MMASTENILRLQSVECSSVSLEENSWKKKFFKLEMMQFQNSLLLTRFLTKYRYSRSQSVIMMMMMMIIIIIILPVACESCGVEINFNVQFPFVSLSFMLIQ